MNYVPLGIKTDYSLLNSLIKVQDLFPFLKANKIDCCGLIDNNLFGVMNFYLTAKKYDIKPIIGLEITYNNKKIYLFVKNYDGLKNLFKINTYINENKLDIEVLKLYKDNLILVVPYGFKELYEEFSNIYSDCFISFSNDSEFVNSKLITNKIVYLNEILCLKENDTNYINYLNMIKLCKTKSNYDFVNYKNNYFNMDIKDEYKKSTLIFKDLCNLEIKETEKYIPKYKGNDDNYTYLYNLALKGLMKRLNGKINNLYKERFLYELKVIKDMGFVDYFLIVYDYVKFAINNGIYVGPGRGSAAGSLISYSLGITQIDPLKYDLLFERFLNPERITMPDIDIDFDASKRYLVIDYVKQVYGEKRVAGIITFATLASKQVLRDVARCLEISDEKLNVLLKQIDSKLSLLKNQNSEVIKILNDNLDLKNLYNISMSLEGVKRQIGTHAAGVVISSKDLDLLVPVVKNNGNYLTGYTMEYLETLGLIKMDFLAIKDLTILANTVSDVEKSLNRKFLINKISLSEAKVYEEFSLANTTGVFQFESSGMKNFLRKLKPSCFNDLIAALALFRPGPMDNIDLYIRRKNGKEKINYYHDDLKPILESTYGIIVYQEQIMQILNTMADYSYAESDLIRRAISKKKIDIIEKEKINFIKRSVNKGYSESLATQIYNLIVKFANYGFNKSHSVAYSLVAYQMMYLKVFYKEYFIINLLNSNIGSEAKTKEYLMLARKENIMIYKPDINFSTNKYEVYQKGILLPINIVKNVGSMSCEAILKERLDNGKYVDYFDFVKRVYGFNVNKKILETLIIAGILDCFKLNRNTMLTNLDNAISYAELVKDLDESLVLKPVIKFVEEINDVDLMQNEAELYGFFVSNHPASKYTDVVKAADIKLYFDKIVKTVVLVENIKTIETKNKKKMAFIQASDETGVIEYTVFPDGYNLIQNIKKGSLVGVVGRVEKRMDRYQIIVNNLNLFK